MNQNRKKEMLEKMRSRMKKKGGYFNDPTEFRPPRVKKGESLVYKFFVLPPVEAGDKTKDGKATRSEDFIWVNSNKHKIGRKYIPCPREHTENTDCPVCDLASELFDTTEDKAERSDIARNFLPNNGYMINIYFPNIKTNPEDLRGKVCWMRVGKTIYDIFEECIYADNEGDSDAPRAFGDFTCSDEAHLFVFKIKLKNSYNNYDNSMFSVKKQPIAKTSEKIEVILNQRFDLRVHCEIDKFTEEDLAAMNGYVDNFLNGGAEKQTSKKLKEKAKKVKVKEAEEAEEAEEVTEIIEETEETEEVTEEAEVVEEAEVEEVVDDDDIIDDDDDDEELAELLAKVKNKK